MPAPTSTLRLPGLPDFAPPAPTSAGLEFPRYGIIDDFERASLGTAYKNPAFGAPNFAIINLGVLVSNSGNTELATQAKYGPDVEAYFTLTALPGSFSVSLRAQVTDFTSTASYYAFDVTPSSSLVQIERVVAGVTTVLGANITRAVKAGDSLGLRVTGETTALLEFWHRQPGGPWQLVDTRTDTRPAQIPYVAGHIGIGLPNATARVDDLGAGPVLVSTPLRSNTFTDPVFPPTGLTLYPSQQPYFPPPDAGGAVSETPTPGGAIADGFGPVVQVATTQGGALAGGNAATATVSVTQGGALASGTAPTATTSVTQGGASTGGFAAPAFVNLTQGGAIAGGVSPTAPISETVTAGGALAAGFGPLAQSTFTIGGALAAGLGGTARVTFTIGGASAGGYGPNDGSAPTGPTEFEDPNHFVLLHA